MITIHKKGSRFYLKIYELLFIIPFYVDPKDPIQYYSNKIEEKGGKIIKSDIFTDNSLDLQAEEKLKDHCVLLKYSIDKQYNSYIIECLKNDIDIIRHIFIDTTNNKEHQEENFVPKCPFCGGKFHILLCDEEGNPHNDNYLKDPYNGVYYYIAHSRYDVPKNAKCPIAQEDYLEPIGNCLYETKEEALEALKIKDN